MAEHWERPDSYKKARVLIAEDEDILRGGYVRDLKKENCEIFEADSPLQVRGLVSNATEPFDVLFLDWEYTKGAYENASGLLDWLAHRRDCADLFIVVVSAHPKFEVVKDALRRGAADWINKNIGYPQTVNQMLSRLHAGLKWKIERKRARAWSGLFTDIAKEVAHNMSSKIGNGEATSKAALEMISSWDIPSKEQINSLVQNLQMFELIWPRLRLFEYDLNHIGEVLDERTPQKFDLNEIVEMAHLNALQEFPVTSGRIKVNLNLQGELPTLHGFPRMIASTFEQLVQNSIKAMPLGGSLSLQTSRVGNNLIGSVADTGIGIPDGELKKIFRIKYSSWNRAAPGTSGTGLGLYLVKRYLVDLHGGYIMVSSELGKGTRFEIGLPLGGIDHDNDQASDILLATQGEMR